VLLVPADQVAAINASLDALELAHWQIGEVVAATGTERVRIG